MAPGRLLGRTFSAPVDESETYFIGACSRTMNSGLLTVVDLDLHVLNREKHTKRSASSWIMVAARERMGLRDLIDNLRLSAAFRT